MVVMVDYLLLPSEITTEIFTKLHVKYILRCRSVCKTWCVIIDNSRKAANMHFPSKQKQTLIFLPYDRHSVYLVDLNEQDYSNLHLSKIPSSGPKTPLQLTSKCYVNGLICFSTLSYNKAFGGCNMSIYNPATQESIKLPKLPTPHFEKAYLVTGLGFDSSSKQYKVVQLCHTRTVKNGGDINTEVQVLTLGGLNSSWRRLENVPKIESYVGSSSALVNGVLFWITTGRQILSFDLVSEKFEFIAFPPIHSGSQLISLMNLNGYLTVVVDPCRFLDLWMLKDSIEHGSWTTFRINLLECPNSGGYTFPICLWKENEILLLRNSRILICYNFHTREYGPTIEIDGIPKNKGDSTTKTHSYEVYPYVANLISLNLESVCKVPRSKAMKESLPTLSAMKKQMQEGR